MSALLIQNAYGPKSNKAVTPEAVLKGAREAADKDSKATGTTATPAFIHVISWPISVIINTRLQSKHAKRDKLEGDDDDDGSK